MSFRSYDLLKLVQDYGHEVTIKKTSNKGTYNPSTGSVDGVATTNYVTTSYFFNFSIGLPTGDEVRAGNSRCVIPALGLAIEPDDDDKIISFSKTYGIVSVKTIYANGDAVCYICEVRD